MKVFWIYFTIVVGAGIVFAGFIYDILFAGLPYLDPTPEMSANYAFHADIASTIRWIGFVVVLVGLLSRILFSIIRRFKPERE